MLAAMMAMMIAAAIFSAGRLSCCPPTRFDAAMRRYVIRRRHAMRRFACHYAVDMHCHRAAYAATRADLFSLTPPLLMMIAAEGRYDFSSSARMRV